MTSPSAPAFFTPSQVEFVFGVEDVTAGVPPVGGAGHAIIREPCISIVPTVSRMTYEAMEYTGNAAVHVGSDETQHGASVVVTVPFRTSGFAAYACMAICGDGAEAVSGSYIHTGTPSITTNRQNTFTIWYNTGDSAHTMQMVYGTITDISLSVDPTGVLMASITLQTFFPVPGAHPTIDTYIGSTATYLKTRVLGNQGTYSLKSSAGTAYVNKILGATIDLSRAFEALPNAQGLNPADIATGELVTAVSFNAEYDGIGAATIYKNYLDYVELGDSTHKHSILFTDADLNTATFTFWPAKFADGTTLDYSGTIVKIAAVLNNYHDLASVNTASPKQTMLESIAIKNGISTAFCT